MALMVLNTKEGKIVPIQDPEWRRRLPEASPEILWQIQGLQDKTPGLVLNAILRAPLSGVGSP